MSQTPPKGPTFQRDFSPSNLNDLVCDYSVLFSDDFPALQRVRLSKKCKQHNLLVITLSDLSDVHAPRCFPSRSIFVIVGNKASLSSTLTKHLAGLPYIAVPDFLLDKLLDDCAKTQTRFNEAIASRLGLPVSYIHQAPLVNGWANSSSVTGSFGNSMAVIQQSIQAASSSGAIINAIRGDSAQVISMVFAIQDMNHVYGPQFSDPVKCDVPLGVSAVVPPTFLNLQSYTPIQMLPVLCDNPCSQFYYLNDCRPITLYIDGPIPNIPLPRLLIRPHNIIPQIIPSVDLAIQKGENILKVAGDMSKAHIIYENTVQIAVSVLAKTYYNAILEAKQTLELIQENIAHVKAGKPVHITPRDFCCDKKVVDANSYHFPDLDFTKLPVSPELVSAYPDLILDYDELGLVFGYRVLNFFERKRTWSSWDPHAPLVASPLGSYFLGDSPLSSFRDESSIGTQILASYYSPTPFIASTLGTAKSRIESEIARLRARDSDDVILIRPVRSGSSQQVIAVPRNGRPFTTFQLINAMTYLGRNIQTINKIRASRHSTEELGDSMKRGSSKFSNDYTNKFGVPLRSIYDDVNGVSHKRQVSETDDNEDGLQEDRSRGKCAVCGVNYLNYFDHIRSHVHIAKYRELLHNLGIYKPLQKCSSTSEYKVSICKQLTNTAMFIVTREQKQYDIVARKLNECLNAMGSHIRLDPYDVPRSNSPTCRASAFTTWRERILRSQQQGFNDALSKSIGYYGSPNILMSDEAVSSSSEARDVDEVGMMGAIINGTGAFLRSQKSVFASMSSSAHNGPGKSFKLRHVRSSLDAYCDLLMQASMSAIGFDRRLRATELLRNAALETFPPSFLASNLGLIDAFTPIRVPFRGIEDLLPDRVLYKPLYDLRNDIIASQLSQYNTGHNTLGASHLHSHSPSRLGALGESTRPVAQSLSSHPFDGDVNPDTYDEALQAELIDEYLFTSTHKSLHHDTFPAYSEEVYMYSQDLIRETLNFRYGYFAERDIFVDGYRGRNSSAFNVNIPAGNAAETSTGTGIGTDLPSVPPRGDGCTLLEDVFGRIYRHLASSFYSLPVSMQSNNNVRIFSELQESDCEERVDSDKLASPKPRDSQSRNLEAMTESILTNQLGTNDSTGSSHSRFYSSLTLQDKTRKNSIGLLSYNCGDTPLFESDGFDSSAIEASGSLLETRRPIKQPSLLSALLVHDSETSADGRGDLSTSSISAYTRHYSRHQQPIEIFPYVPETILRNDVNTIDTYLGLCTEDIVVRPYVLPGHQSAVDVSSDISNAEYRGDTDAYDQDSIVGGFIKKLSKHCVTSSNFSSSGYPVDERTSRLVSTSTIKNHSDIILPMYKKKPLFLPSVTRILNTHLPLNQHKTFAEIYDLPRCIQSRVIIPPEYEIRPKQTPNIDDYVRLFFENDMNTGSLSTSGAVPDLDASSFAYEGDIAFDIPNFAILSTDDYYLPAMLLQRIGGIGRPANPAFYPIVSTILKMIEELFHTRANSSDSTEQYATRAYMNVDANCSPMVHTEERILDDCYGETALDDCVISHPGYPRPPRPNSIPGPVRLAPDSISMVLLSMDVPSGLHISEVHTLELLNGITEDLTPYPSTDCDPMSPASDHITTKSASSSPEEVAAFYRGPQLYERMQRNKKGEDSATYMSTQFSGSDGAVPPEQFSLPTIPIFADIREAYNTSREEHIKGSKPRPHNYLTSIVRTADMRGHRYPQFCTIPWSMISSINSGLITSYLFGNNALLNACFTFEAVANSMIGPSAPSAMIQPIHLAILHAGVTSKLRSDNDLVGYDTFVKRNYTSKSVAEKHPQPAVYNCDGLEDELAAGFTCE